jgi:hypothetical protein
LADMAWTGKYASQKWGGLPRAEYVVRCLDLALPLYARVEKAEPGKVPPERLGGYHLIRGHALLTLSQPDLAKVREEANQALKLTPQSHAPLGLLARSYMIEARQPDVPVEAIRKALVQAVSFGEQALAKASGTERAFYLIEASSAYVEQTNYTLYDKSKPFEKHAELLRKARDYAEEAELLDPPYLGYVQQAKGNAYEDLAWICEEDPAANYKKAIAAFLTVAKPKAEAPKSFGFDTSSMGGLSPLGSGTIESGPAAGGTGALFGAPQAKCGLGRVYYRTVAQSWIAPKDLGLEDRDAVLALADRWLASAITDDPDLAEAHLWRARVAQQRAGLFAAERKTDEARQQYQLAEDYFTKAKELAQAQNLAGKANYVVEWARFPLQNGAMEKPEDRLNEARRRANLLKGVQSPPGGMTDPAKEAAVILGVILESEGKTDDALKTYTDALGKNLPTLADVGLLQMRAHFNLRACKRAWDWKAAEQALRDADQCAALAMNRDTVAGARKFTAQLREAMALEAAKSDAPKIDPKLRGSVAAALDDIREVFTLQLRRPILAEYRWAVDTGVRDTVPRQGTLPPDEWTRLGREYMGWQRKIHVMTNDPKDLEVVGLIAQKFGIVQAQ